jgi:flagellar motor switch protein FliG
MDLIPMDPSAAMPVVGSPPIPPKPDLTLSRKAKAAIVVRFLLNNGADIPLEDLPEDLQIKLTQQMGQMRVIDRDTLAYVVDEFAQEVERIGLRFPGDMAGALSALDGKISPQTAERIRSEAGALENADPWKVIRAMDVKALVPVMENEAVEVAAVLLSKLDVPQAAALLGEIPGPLARKITYAVSKTNSVTPSAVDRIGQSLAVQLTKQPVRVFDDGPVERVGAILNSSTSLTRDNMLEGLTETDEGFATAVRKAIFTFAHIPARIQPRDIPGILRNVDQADLVIALGGAEIAEMQSTADFILANLSSRMADQLREEVQDAETPKLADAEASMGRVVGTIREMAAAGELEFIIEEEDDEED